MKRAIMAVVLGAAVFAFTGAGAAQASDVCGPLDSGKIDTTGDPSTVTVTAPDGFLIDQYCVKAGSSNNGAGPVYVDVDPHQKTITFGHPSGKDVSHYSVGYTSTPTTTAPPTTAPPTTAPPTTAPPTTAPPTTEPPVTTVPPTTEVPPTTLIPPVTSPPEEPPPTDPPVVTTVPPTVPPTAPPPSTPTPELPSTGSGETAMLALLATLLLGTGWVLVRITRRAS